MRISDQPSRRIGKTGHIEYRYNYVFSYIKFGVFSVKQIILSKLIFIQKTHVRDV